MIQTELELERNHRIVVALAAWAYERYADPIMTDAQFDVLARSIRPEMDTGHAVMDAFFRTQFNSSTGQWIYKHPELHLLDAALRRTHPDIGKVHDADEDPPVSRSELSATLDPALPPR